MERNSQLATDVLKSVVFCKLSYLNNCILMGSCKTSVKYTFSNNCSLLSGIFTETPALAATPAFQLPIIIKL